MNRDPRMEEYNYWNDHRVQAGLRQGPTDNIDGDVITHEIEECDCEDCLSAYPVYDPCYTPWSEQQRFNLPRGGDVMIQLPSFCPLERKHAEALDALHLWPFVNNGYLLFPGYEKARRMAKRLNELVGSPTEYPGPHVFVLPARREVCPTCDGKGSHVNPSIDAGGLTYDDFYDEPDFYDDYSSGVYDVACYECHGNRVILVPDESRTDEKVLKLYYDYLQDQADYAAEVAAERRMGC